MIQIKISKEKLKSSAIFFWAAFLDLVFPPKCPGCKKAGEKEFCPQCFERLPWMSDWVCAKCGMPALEGSSSELCPECRRRTRFYDQLRAVFHYQDPVKNALFCFKYQGKKNYGKMLAKFLPRFAESADFPPAADLIIPVPLAEKKLKERGFNQAEILAVALAEDLKIPLKTQHLKRVRPTISQSKLNKAQREENVRNAFKLLYPNHLRGKKILLIDDVVTTTATLNECARMLKNAGALKVYGLTLCGRSFNPDE